MRPAGAVAALGLVLAGWPLTALGQTSITPDVGAGRGVGTTVESNGAVFSIDGGTRAGGNLFHSFQQFSLGAGDTALWTRAAGDAAAITNVINRVTGGQASQIAGTLDSTALPNASFYFINPSGIVFAAGARVNVPAAAYFSSAAELRLADGARFSAAAPNGSTLSMAAPASFGFVGGQGAITVSGVAETFAAPNLSLMLVGSDVGVSDSRLVVRGLDIVATGAGAAAPVTLADPLAGVASGAIDLRNSRLTVTAGAAAAQPIRMLAGQVNLTGSGLVADAGGAGRGGDVRISAGRVRLADASMVVTSTRGPGAGGDVAIVARDFAMDGGSVVTVSTGAGAGGRLAITADTLSLTGAAAVVATTGGKGLGGNVELSAGTLSADTSLIVASVLGDGAGGNVRIIADTIAFTNSSVAGSAGGFGKAGDILIQARTLSTSGGLFGSPGLTTGDSGNLTILATEHFEAFSSIFTSVSDSVATAGSIFIRSPEVFIERGSITTSALGDGGAGAVMIDAGTIGFSDVFVSAQALNAVTLLGLVQLKATGDIVISGGSISSDARGQADGGRIALDAKNIHLVNASISTDTLNLGNAGRLSLIASDTLHISNSAVTSNSNSRGMGGGVLLQAGTILLDIAAQVHSDALDLGDAGGVAVRATTLTLTDGSSITSSSPRGAGDAGRVLIEADRVTLFDSVIASSTFSLGDAGQVNLRVGELVIDASGQDRSFITSETRGQGQAGGVDVGATRSITLQNGGFLSSNTLGDGNAGLVSVRADTLNVINGSFIASDSFGFGDAGDVLINAGTVRLTGGDGPITYISSDTLEAGNAGTVTINATRSLTAEHNAFISSDTYTLGDAGDIQITAGVVTLRDFGAIRSRTLSNGEAGNISIAAKLVTLADGGTISSEATDTSVGNAGLIGIEADEVTLGEKTLVSTASSGAGDAGAVAIVAKTLTIEGGVVSSSTQKGAQGQSGTLRLQADTLRVLNGGRITTVSNNPNPAGQIVIAAGSLLVDGQRTLISSESLAGDPRFDNPRGERGDAGAVLITSGDTTISNGGRITTNSFAGAAGEILIATARPGILVLEGGVDPGSIQTSSGAGTGGQITIANPLAIISNGGSILALGQQRGAQVRISSRFFINSSDRVNTVEVDGDFRLQTGLYDVSSGTVSRDLSVLDASKVLQGQCPVARSTGLVSQLITRPVGPYVRDQGFLAPPPRAGTATIGACS